MIDRTSQICRLAVVASLLCVAAPMPSIAAADLDAVLMRLDALEKENAQLRQRVKRLEGTSARAEKPATAAYAAARPDHTVVEKAPPMMPPVGPRWEAEVRALYWESPGAIDAARTTSASTTTTQHLDLPFSPGVAGSARYYVRPATFVEIGGYWWASDTAISIAGSAEIGNVNANFPGGMTGATNQLDRDIYSAHLSTGTRFDITPWWTIEPGVGLAWMHLEDRQSGTISGRDFLLNPVQLVFDSSVEIDSFAARLGLSNSLQLSESLHLTAAAHALVGVARGNNSLMRGGFGSAGLTVDNATGAFWGAEANLGFSVTRPWGNASATFQAQYDFLYYDVSSVYRAGTYFNTPPQNVLLHGPSAGLKITY